MAPRTRQEDDDDDDDEDRPDEVVRITMHNNNNQSDYNDDNDNNNNSIKDERLGILTTEEEEEEEMLNNNNNNNDTTTKTTTIALCVCMLTHSYLLISVFPYSGFMAQHLLHNIQSEDDASKYAGMIASTFMIGRACTSYYWGKIADIYGRTIVLYVSLLLSIILSICFGLIHTSFQTALIIRFLMGCSNGIMSTIKTVVSEISTKDQEAKIMNIVIGMWGWGFLISPALSGAIADPITQYPNYWNDDDNNNNNIIMIIKNILQTYPFLLPNVLGAIICIIGIILVRMFVHETLQQPRNIWNDLKQILYQKKLQSYIPYYKTYTNTKYRPVPVLKHHQSDHYLTSEEEDDYEYIISGTTTTISNDNNDNNNNNISLIEKSTTNVTMISLLRQRDIFIKMVIYCLYSFVGLCIDEVIPLFCLSHIAGFGIHEKDIGTILSLCGLLFAICQYTVYNKVYTLCGGLYGCIKFGSALSAPLMFLIPISVLINNKYNNTDENNNTKLHWATLIYLSTILAIHRCFSLVFFSSISVALNRSVTSNNRATINGLSVVGGSIAKSLGPTFAGFLTSISVSLLHQYASILIFSIIGCLGLSVAIASFLFLHEEENNDNENSDRMTITTNDSSSVEEKVIEMKQVSKVKEIA